jgi:HPt (histidine-containing phosphotransfer) domain-containing protein
MNAPKPPEEADAAPPRPAAFDAVALARLRELDPAGRNGVLQRVLGAFENSLVRMLAQLEAQRQAPDAGAVAALAHTVKSSSASVGALDLAAACAAVELRLRTAAPGDLGQDIERLVVESESALSIARAMLRP